MPWRISWIVSAPGRIDVRDVAALAGRDTTCFRRGVPVLNMRSVFAVPFLLGSLAWLAGTGIPLTAEASEDRYRLELIIFRNLGVQATPVNVNTPNRYSEAFEFDETAIPGDPTLMDPQDGTFASIWSRLDRLAEYEPLLRLTYEQSAFDFHPPVRSHGEEVLAEVVDADDWNTAPGMTGEPAGQDPSFSVSKYFRLDGAVQLRRSRFLHVEMDIEYRLDGPAWQREFGLPPGFEWIGEPPAETSTQRPEPTRRPEPVKTGPINARQPMTEAGPLPLAQSPQADPPEWVEPFQVHRLQQSRQVLTDTLQYFDSAFLGAIVRVTEISDEET